MNKFYEIATDHYVPLSHDNSYLFNHYDRITNFLTFNIDQQYRNLLAKPIKNGYQIEWFSAYPNLVKVQGVDFEEFAYSEFYKFLEVIQEKIEFLKLKKDKDANNWAEILEKVFNKNDIFIYSNGEKISLVWGWKFDNNEIYKPAIQLPQLDNEIKDEIQMNDSMEGEIAQPIKDEIQMEKLPEQENGLIENEIPLNDSSLNKDVIKNPLKEQIEEEEDLIERKEGFLEFLKWFASKYWWFLIVLLVLIVLVFLYKSLLYSQHEQVFL